MKTKTLIKILSILISLAVTAVAHAGFGTLYVKGCSGRKVYVNDVCVGIARDRVCYFVNDGFWFSDTHASPGWDANETVKIKVAGSDAEIIFTQQEYGSYDWIAVFTFNDGSIWKGLLNVVDGYNVTADEREQAVKGDVSMFAH